MLECRGLGRTYREGPQDVTVLDERGVGHELTSLWRHRRILLVFLRHFGCRFCK